MPPAFLSVSGSEDVRRPSSAQGRLESGSATHRTQPPAATKQQHGAYLTYNQHVCQTARTRSSSSASSNSSASSASSASSFAQHRYDDDAPSASWSQRLLSNAQHISPSVAQHYALPTATPTHHSTNRRSSIASSSSTASTRTPALANFASRHLPSSPYLQQHLSILAQQLGSELTAQHLTEREEDNTVHRTVKRSVRQEMTTQQQQQRNATPSEEHKEQHDTNTAPPVYPFTSHATALRQHVLTLSRLQGRFDTLVASISRSSSLHSLLSSFSASYLTLFQSLLSTLFSLNHHYHFTLHHASFTLSSQQAEHAATLSTLQHRVRLVSAATHSHHTLAHIEAQQRAHNATQIAQLHNILRQQAADIQQQAQHTAQQVDHTTLTATATGTTTTTQRDSMLELSAETFMQSHQLSLLLNALCYEAEEEATERAKLDTLMDEGRKSAKEMWMNTVAKKKEDTAAKIKDKQSREKQVMLAAANGAATSGGSAGSPRGGSGGSAAGPYVVNGFTLVPVLSRFMRGVQTLWSPKRNAASLESVNGQLVNILVALPSGVSVSEFPGYVLSVIVTAQTNPQAAQRHLRSLFTHCTAHCQQPLPRLVLPLIASYTGKSSQFSSGLTPRSGQRAAADDPAPLLVQPNSFTLHVVAESLRFLQPLLAAAADKDLTFPIPLLQSQIPALMTAFYQPISVAGDRDGALQSHLLSYLDAQSLLSAVSLVDVLLVFASVYHEMMSDWMREQLTGRAAQAGWDELTQLMRAMCGSDVRWEAVGKSEVAKVYVEWTSRCGELAAASGGSRESDVDDVDVLLDVLSLHRWFMNEVHTS